MAAAPTTAQEFAQTVNSGQKAWDWSWSDSTKEQYFNYLSAEQANQHELDMWRLNNEYNTPKAQMQRMIDAGINPAAAYGQVSSGSASSAPATHPVQSAHWRDTQDQVAKVNMALSAVNSIFSNIDQVIGSAQGIQGMSLAHQKSYIDQLRYANLKQGIDPIVMNSQYIKDAGLSPNQYFQVGSDQYVSARDAILFPELFGASKAAVGYGTYDSNLVNSYWLNKIREKNLKVDELLQQVTQSVEQGDWRSMFKNAFELLMINLFRRY